MQPDTFRPDFSIKGPLCGLLAAALFGASAPVAKLILPSAGPIALAGLLYLGAGISLSLFRLLRAPNTSFREARLVGTDYALLFLITLLGGLLGPVLMLVGLARMSGVSATLLLNLEAPLTILVAVALFGEHLGRKEALSTLLIFSGVALLSYRPAGLSGDLLGAAALGGACLCWAIDNNLTQRLSLRDPVAIVQIKTLGAGLSNLGLAFLLGQKLPPPVALGGALVLGSLSYGLSVVLDTYALRMLGAAREAAFFATAPFVGALIAIPLLREKPTALDGLAALFMLAGVASLLRARHAHLHAHHALDHEHAHVHDEHHQHSHLPGTLVSEPHSHPHHHAPLVHDHPHVPDSHHRHSHD